MEQHTFANHSNPSRRYDPTYGVRVTMSTFVGLRSWIAKRFQVSEPLARLIPSDARTSLSLLDYRGITEDGYR